MCSHGICTWGGHSCTDRKGLDIRVCGQVCRTKTESGLKEVIEMNSTDVLRVGEMKGIS